MKKLIILAAAFAFMSQGDAFGQNFLNKMKQKAENAVNQQVNRFTGKNNGNSSSDDGGKLIDIADSPSGDNTQITTTLVTDFEYHPQGETSNYFDVDLDNVRPASGDTYDQLLAQLPALPTAAQLANPTEAEYQNYFKKLTAVKLRIEELEDQICQGMIPQYQQPNIKPQGNGNPMASLTPQEIQVMAREAEKIEDEVAAREKKLGRKMTDIEQLNFIRKNHPEFAKVALKMNEAQNGISAAQMEKLLADIDAEAKAKGRDLTEDEMNAIAKAKYPDIYNKGMALNQKQQQNEQAINQQLADIDADKERMRKLQELDTKYARDEESAKLECYQFAAQYEDQLRDIYSQIINTGDKAKVAQLYAKADAMIADYRKNASQSWLNSISNHIGLIKSHIPDRIAIYHTKDECVMNRLKLDELLKVIDDMEDAYGNFPLIAVEPVQVSKTNITCYRYESVFYPKVTGFVQNSRLSKEG
ncbi:MAG: hypothetical protein MJZ66_11665, partial [Bacteroidales bacterium]|nr:hypothetical protein [Bacteroidales bacterium]